MKKIPNPIKIEPIKNKQYDVATIIGCIMILLVLACFLYISLYQISVVNNETKIIKIKYLSTGGLVDSCGHPMEYEAHFDMTKHHPKLGDIYEITITSYRMGNQYITNLKQVEKEKYIENC
jgi:hypothetical protein